MSTLDFITALFSEVDEQMRAISKHPHARLWPSEVVTLGLLHALKGGGNRAFYRWLTRDYRALFPQSLLLDSGVLCSHVVREVNSFPGLLKNKGFKEERKTKVGLDAIDKSTTLESNKSHLCSTTTTRPPRFQLGSLRMIPCAASYSWRLRSYRL